MKAHAGASNKGERFKVSEFVNPSGARAFRVHGYKLDGTRVRQNYSTRLEAQRRKDELVLETDNVQLDYTLRSTRLSAQQIAEAETAFTQLEGRPLLPAVEFYLRNYREPVTQRPIEEALKEFLEAKARENNRPDTITNLRIRCTRLASRHRGRNVAEITSDHVREVVFWPNVSSTTADNNRRALLSWFNWCVKQGYCEANPVAKIDPIKKDREEPETLTLAEARRIMEAARQHKGGILVPYFALALFAAVRPTELARLTWDEIDLAAGTVTIGAKLAKMRQRRIVALAENAVEWLLPHAATRTPIRDKNWRRDFDAVKHAAGFGSPSEAEPGLKPFVPDVLRHTGISNHYAKHQHEGETAAWAGNSPDVIHRHYKGLVSQKDVKAFWSIRPEKAAERIVRMTAAN